MKRLIALAVFALFLSVNLNAQEFSDLDKSPLDAVLARGEDNAALARVIYSRPQKKGREIFGDLVPYGEIWRTGANEATEITFFTDMTVSGKKVPKGTYTLYTIPDKQKWTVILNKNVHVWGTQNYYKEEQDLLRIKAPARQAAQTIENFSMAFQEIDNGTRLMMGWDDIYISIPFKKAK